jgi:hypothetical protein
MRLIIVAALAAMTSFSMSAIAQDYSYDVSGTADGSIVTGTVDSWNGSPDVEGTIVTEDGEQKSFQGEWVGKGEIEGYDEDGNYVELQSE